MNDLPEPTPSERPKAEPVAGSVRHVVEFLVTLCVSILVFRTFAAEAYVVPTGSMAPTLLGNHKELVCPNCSFRFTMGLDESGRSGRPICPNCGQNDLDERGAVDRGGDRVLVQKFLFDVRRPKRWEVSVFHFPGEPTQAYVKRVVGLPGESIRIKDGDVYVDGVLARKTLREQRAMRQLVYDHSFPPRDGSRYPRWLFRRGRGGERLASGWKSEGTRFVHEAVYPPIDRWDWVEYHHWNPDRARYGAIHDFNAYNGAEVRGENVVIDIMVEARVATGPDARSVALRIDSGSDRFLIEIPVGEDAKPVVTRNRKTLQLVNAGGGLTPSAEGGGALVEASVMDRRLIVAVDGKPLFDSIDYDDPAVGPGPTDSPIAFGAKGGAVSVGDVRIYRDVYYTSNIAFTPHRPFGVDSPYLLGRDEYFVLGDNSPVSNDSRFWEGSPVVPGELFLGKPFLVHLPGQAVPLKVFGRSLYWVPDPREIRYIR